MTMKAGDKVTYVSDHGTLEHGIIKSVQDEDHIFVVYNCAGNWDRIEDYTAARTHRRDLVEGWKGGGSEVAKTHDPESCEIIGCQKCRELEV